MVLLELKLRLRLDKDALTSKSFAKIVRLESKILLFSNKLVSKDQSVQTEE